METFINGLLAGNQVPFDVIVDEKDGDVCISACWDSLVSVQVSGITIKHRYGGR